MAVDFKAQEEVISKHLEDEFAKFHFDAEEGVVYEDTVKELKFTHAVYIYPVILRKDCEGKILSYTYLRPIIRN